MLSGKPHAPGHVLLAHHVLSFEHPRLPHPRLRRHVHHVAVRKSRQPGAHMLDHAMDAVAPLELGAREVGDLHAVQPRHVRAVAPHDPRQRRLQPPVVPRAADHPPRLEVECGMGRRLLELEPLRLVGVHAAEAEHRRHHVGAVAVRGARGGGDVEVAGRVDHHRAHDRLASLLALDDHALDPPVAHDAAGEQAVQPQVDPGLPHHVVARALPAVGIEGDRVADRVRFRARVEVEQSPARPLAEHRRIVAALRLGRKHRMPARGHPVDQLGADAAHGDLGTCAHVVQHQHHPARRKAAEIGVALDQAHRSAVARGGDRGAETGRAAAHDDDFGAGGDGQVAGRFGDEVRHVDHPCCGAHRTHRRSSRRMKRKNATENTEPQNTVAYSSALSKL